MRGTKMLWCRNCREQTEHEYIGTSAAPCPPGHGLGALVRRARNVHMYACKICRCERRDVARTGTL